MENFVKKSDQLNLESIKLLASQNTLKQRLKPNDTFYIATPQISEIEPLLKQNNIDYKKTPHPTYNLTIFTVLN